MYYSLIISGELDVTFLYLRDEPIKMGMSYYTGFTSLKFAVGALAILMIKWISDRLPDSVLLLVGLGFKISMLLYMSWILSVQAAFAGKYFS